MILNGGEKPPLQIQMPGSSPAATRTVAPVALGCNGPAWAQRARLKPVLLSGGAGHALVGAFGDVAFGLVPAPGAFERCGDRAGLETQFALRAGAIHKHHVGSD